MATKANKKTGGINNAKEPSEPIMAPISRINGIGDKIAEVLQKNGINTVLDLLCHFPTRYEDWRTATPIAQLEEGMQLIRGTIVSAGTTTSKNGRKFYDMQISDESGVLYCRWIKFSAQFFNKLYKANLEVQVSGQVTFFQGKPQILHPTVEIADQREDNGVLPVYPLFAPITQRQMRKFIQNALQDYLGHVTHRLPEEIVQRQKLHNFVEAVYSIHTPPADVSVEELNNHDTVFHRSVAFDDFFMLQLGNAIKRRHYSGQTGITFKASYEHIIPLTKLLPYKLTGAQRRVLGEIKRDMESSLTMSRLVQGDVGSGKTMVALFSAMVAVESDYQVALLAPTEILAEQHYKAFKGYCDELGVSVALVTGSGTAADRRKVQQEVSEHRHQIVVGTHAIFQESLQFAKLGLVIIDEQHRFGVAQRMQLQQKGSSPDVLVMTATPIPRTLALSVYGDLAVSVIDELPPGRSPITTKMCMEYQRHHVHNLVKREVDAGRQAYFIYPLVEDSESVDLTSAVSAKEKLELEVFPGLKVGLLHGKHTQTEKEAIMLDFKQRNTDILVSTTVVEVGVDVPNASVIVIEHAERFGLAQLHQLRGRVGRGSAKSFCVLMASPNISDDGKKRLAVMESTQDGFRIAEADLEIRGPGDFIGARQSGMPDFRLASLTKDAGLLETARQEAFGFLDRDKYLTTNEGISLRKELKLRWPGDLPDLNNF